MELSNIRPLGIRETPYTILQKIEADLPDIKEIYVMFQDKDGSWRELYCGTAAGGSFAALLLQKATMGCL